MHACHAAGIAAREVHGFIIRPNDLPVSAERHRWLEVLIEGSWTAVDPRIVSAIDESESIRWRGISCFHVKVCHSTPDKATAAFLDSPPPIKADWQQSASPKFPSGMKRKYFGSMRRRE